VNYPSAFRVMLNDEFFYQASVDVRDSPAEPGKTLPGQPEPLGVPVAVKCEVAARLVAASDDLTVDDKDWRARAFTPTGVIDWTWVVNGVKLGRHELRLEIQPAVRLEDGVLLVGDDSPAISSFLSSVDVEGSPIQVVGAWVEDNRGPIVSVAGVIGVAVLAVLTWTGTLATTVRRVRGQWRGQAVDDQPNDDQPDPG
jgi:hypothetical protein